MASVWHCSTPPIQWCSVVNKSVVDRNCLLGLLFQLNCHISAEMHLFQTLLLVFLNLNQGLLFLSFSTKQWRSWGIWVYAVCLSYYFVFGWFVCEPLGCCVIQNIKQLSVRKKDKKTKLKLWNTRLRCEYKVSRLQVSCFIVLWSCHYCSIWISSEQDWLSMCLVFSISLTLHIILQWWVMSPLLCHGWVSISVPNDCTTELSFNASLASILLGSGWRWTWTALKTSLVDSFHDQPSQLAVWFIPERQIRSEMERESEREVTLLFHFQVECSLRGRIPWKFRMEKAPEEGRASPFMFPVCGSGAEVLICWPPLLCVSF